MYLVTKFPTYLPIYKEHLLLTPWVIKGLTLVHPQLSQNWHPVDGWMDGVLVGAVSLWPFGMLLLQNCI
jgi:hypothetical protein